MKVKELILLLSEADGESDVEIVIRSYSDAAWTRSTIEVASDPAQKCTAIRGYVHEDDEDAYLPGVTSEDEDEDAYLPDATLEE